MIRIKVAMFLLVAISATTACFGFEYRYAKNGFKYVYHRHSEASYQKAWCSANNGIEEYENKDMTRVDCLTPTHAVEFDFANKWAESIGQALHYGFMTGKKPKVVLILDNPQEQMVYFHRVRKLAERYGFDIEYVTNDILRTDNEGKCDNPECKCHKQRKKVK
jgi:hypothetical protein